MIFRVRRKTPRIAVDTWALGSYARNHGIHVYAGKLLTYFREMAESYGVEIMPFVSPCTDNDANRFAPAPGFSPRVTRLLKADRQWRYGGACAISALSGADLVFSPHCTSFYFGQPSVITIHDLIPVLMPFGSRRAASRLQTLLWTAAHFSRAIITDSQHSKEDIMRIYGVPESKISVIHLAYDKEFFNTGPNDAGHLSATKTRLGITRPYVLHTGVIKPNKNLKRLIQAYRMVMGRRSDLEVDLVLVGSLGWEYDDVVAAANDSTAPGRVVMAGPLRHEDMITLLKGAHMVAMPSLYEGFCLPLLESMACGVPTIASNASCLPEISGGVLRYFDPSSVTEMADALEEALSSQELRTELSTRGVQRAADFDWRKCAEQTLSLLARVAGKNGR
jgi:glycosyltransferase involved in cell wall biosynthesis